LIADGVVQADGRRSFPSNAGVFAIAAVLLGCALQRNTGFYDELALAGLTAALCLTAAGVFGALSMPRRAMSRGALEGLLLGGIGLQLALLVVEVPAVYLRIGDPADLWPFRSGIAVAGCIVLATGLRSRVFDRVGFPLLLAIHFALGVWVLDASPSPAIDVITVHRDAIAALADAENPYAITFANIYDPTTPFYAPGMVVDQRVQFGLPYPPLSLLLAAPGELLFGDYRYANLVALSLAAAAIGYTAPTRAARLVAILFLFTPRVFFVLEQGWTEPFVVLLLAVTVFCALNAERWTPLAVGGLIAVKQYLVFGIPLSLLLVPRPWWPTSLTLLWRAAAVGAAITLPFVIWNPPAFFRSVVTLQIYEPFRLDSLSYLSFLARQLSAPPPVWIAIVPIALVLGFVLWRAPRSPSVFAASVALITFLLFAFGKKAFCNYYFFVIGALCSASAALTHPAESAGVATDRSRSARL